MERTLLVQKNTHGRIKFIELTLEGAVVSRVWGLIDGKTQSTSNEYDYINKGKANELSPSEAALADFNRINELKNKEGYLYAKSLDELPEFDNDQMDFDDLPVQFCCSKPHASISASKCNKLIKQKLARIFIKENGLCHYILITSTGDVKIYSRRIDDHTRKYPEIVESVRGLKLPKRTLMIVELVIDPQLEIPHMLAFKLIRSISKSDVLNGKVKESVEKTLALQEEHRVVAVIFNILFLDGEDATERTYDEILETLIDDPSKDDPIILPRKMEFTSYKEAYEWVDANKDQYEGLVIWNGEENAEITYNGKPNRRACYKLKAVLEDDVVAYAWQEGTGAKQGKVGSLLIGKYNLEGEMVPMGKVGSGLKIKEGECELDYWNLPCVIAINFDQRFPTGAYQFPRFDKKHEDKVPSDIVVGKDGF